MKDKTIILDINGNEYKVVINRFTAAEAELTVNGTSYTVGLKDLGIEQVADIKPQQAPRPEKELHKPAEKKASTPRSPVHRPQTVDDKHTIKAPLPGMILKIFVKEGDVIKSGQPVIMLEAMKMENEVNATGSGMVIDIRFKEGDSVNQGDALILLKPVED